LQKTDYKKQLDPAIVSKLKTLELKARSIVEGFMVGLHKSPYHGFSAEFSEHRSYQQGDPLKNIDWKVFAKSEKYFIKQFEDETNLISHIILDVSKSMDYKQTGSVTKFEYGVLLAASLAYILIRQQDSVGLIQFSDHIENYLAPRSNRIHIQNILRDLEKSVPANKTTTGNCLNLVAEKIKKRGLSIIISDFFDDPDSIIEALNRLYYKRNEVIVFQILDPIEETFAFGKDAVFRDMETGEEILTQPHQIQNAYQSAMKVFLSKIKSECRKKNFDYNLILTTDSFDKALLSFFKKRAKLI
jgi:uncharacterized protein (DUF58 family)